MGSSTSTLSDTLQIKIGHDTSESDKTQQPFNKVKSAKYTIFTFVPLTVLGQFMRVANFYFLIITIITCILKNSISNSLSTLIPLIIVILIAELKQAREDIIRHKADQAVNHAIVTVIRNGIQVEIESQFIAPGDLVVIKENTDVPCDLVLLQTTDPQGKCYVTTSNLDGETNLKTLFIPRGLPQVKIDKLNTLGVIECENSKTDLYDFKGKIELSDDLTVLSLSADNLLLRGASVKDTECVIGCAVYLGMQTKLQLNSRLTSHKYAKSEWYINVYLLSLVVFMILFVLLLYFLERYDKIHRIPRMWYMGPLDNANTSYGFFVDFFSLLILFNYLIPISFYGTSELYRLVGSMFMRWDLNLYDEETDEPCIVRSSNLNEELGQIDILFSDKTGTLTKNIMIFQQCSIHGRKYAYRKTQLLDVETNELCDINVFNRDQRKFFEALAICHTVQITAAKGLKTVMGDNIDFRSSVNLDSPEVVLDVADTLSGNVSAVQNQRRTLLRVMSEDRQNEIDEMLQTLDYQAASADEKALIEGCARLGLVYLGDDQEIIKICVLPPHISTARPYSIGEKKGLAYERLHILEFTPVRKRMSVIVRDRTGLIWIYTKGADSSIFPLCNDEFKEMVKITNKHINEFANSGLRILAIARKQLSESDYQQFLSSLNNANNSMNQRQELFDMTYGIVERDLDLLGATAVEDILQDDVESTLISLQGAGIKIWVLTGDKVETALSIAVSCGHISKDAQRHKILDCTDKEELLNYLNAAQCTLDQGRECALLLDSKSMSIALEEASAKFRNIAIRCQAVLCCRLSPLQKSQIVALMRSGHGHYTTAAIGDGANDVSMIQEAHIGIGIIGKEGRQAVMSADYSIAKFSMIQRLLLVHGHYNTIRLARMICFYFYENILITMCIFFYQFFAMHSGNGLYQSIFLSLYTTVYNSIAIVVLSFMEKPYTEEVLMSKPQLYNECRNYKPLGWKNFLLWIADGFYQSVVIFFFAYAMFSTNDVVVNVGQTAGLAVFGTIIIQCVVLVGNLKQFLEVSYVTRCFLRSLAWGIFIFILSTIIHNCINYVDEALFYWAYFNILSSIPVWLFMIVTIIACLLPAYLLRYFREGFWSKERWSLLEKCCSKRNNDSYSLNSVAA